VTVPWFAVSILAPISEIGFGFLLPLNNVICQAQKPKTFRNKFWALILNLDIQTQQEKMQI